MVVLSTAGRFRWCGLRPRLGALLTVSVPLVDSAYSADSGADAVFRDTSVSIYDSFGTYHFGTYDWVGPDRYMTTLGQLVDDFCTVQFRYTSYMPIQPVHCSVQEDGPFRYSFRIISVHNEK